MAPDAAKSEVVRARVDFSVAACANHATGAILIGAKEGTAFVDAIFLRRLGGIEGLFRTFGFRATLPEASC